MPADGRTRRAKVSPGPGSHDLPIFPDPHPSSTIASSGGFSMASDGGRMARKKKTRMGPGSHHPKYEVVESCHHGHVFSGQKRFERVVGCADTPGPTLLHGDHPRFKRPPTFGFGNTEKFFMCPGLWGKAQLGRGLKMPAPGEHNPDDSASSRRPTGPAYSATPRRNAIVLFTN